MKVFSHCKNRRKFKKIKYLNDFEFVGFCKVPVRYVLVVMGGFALINAVRTFLKANLVFFYNFF